MERHVYRFPVQDKWIYVYLTESGREKTYLLQFGDVYTEVQESYENLRCGDFIDVYITSYRKRNILQCPYCKLIEKIKCIYSGMML